MKKKGETAANVKAPSLDGEDAQSDVKASGSKANKRRYNASCMLCRRKRQRCPGRDENGKNLCTTCEARGVPCEYPQNPDATKYDEALELRDLVNSLVTASADQRAEMLESYQAKKKRKQPDSDGEGGGSSGTLQTAAARKKTATGHHQASPPVVSNLPLASNKLEHDVSATHLLNFRRVRDCEKHVSAAIAPAIHTTARDCYLTDTELEVFLDTFFRWHNARFLLPRPLICDYAKNPSMRSAYPSDLLTTSIFTYASRHLMNRRELGEKLCAHAHCLLAEEMCKEPTVATVQGVMFLSMHHATNGRNGQSLSIIGLAEGMMQAMSLSRIGRPKLEQDMFYRTQVAIFNWHVMFSLITNQLTHLEAPNIDELKIELKGMEAEESENQRGSILGLPMNGEENDAFWRDAFLRNAEAFVKLNEILQALFADTSKSQSSAQAFVYRTREALLHWQAGMSSEILMDVDNLPHMAPPPSIVQFNLLVRTLWILLYRRFDESFDSAYTLAGAKSASAYAAREIFEIFRLFEQSLSFSFLNYISIFAAEMAAVTDVHGLPRETPEEREILSTRLALYIRVLQTGEINCPGLAHMIDALRREKEGMDPFGDFLVSAPPTRQVSTEPSAHSALHLQQQLHQQPGDEIPVPPVLSATSDTNGIGIGGVGNEFDAHTSQMNAMWGSLWYSTEQM